MYPVGFSQWKFLAFATQIINNVSSDPVRELMLPVAEKLKRQTDKAYKEEDRLRTHPDDVDEGAVAEVSIGFSM